MSMQLTVRDSGGIPVVVAKVGAVTYTIVHTATVGVLDIQITGKAPCSFDQRTWDQPFSSHRQVRRVDGSWQFEPLTGVSRCNQRRPFDFENPSPWVFGDKSHLRPVFDALVAAESRVDPLLNAIFHSRQMRAARAGAQAFFARQARRNQARELRQDAARARRTLQPI